MGTPSDGRGRGFNSVLAAFSRRCRRATATAARGSSPGRPVRCQLMVGEELDAGQAGMSSWVCPGGAPRGRREGGVR